MTLTDHSEIDERRQTLSTNPNPGPNTDYIVTLSGVMLIEGMPDAIKFRIRYVPDKLILDAGSLDDYIGAVRRQNWSSFEEAALALLTDFNNELVPRWVEVHGETQRGGSLHSAGTDNRYGVHLCERQPAWNNTALLSLLDRH